MVKSIIHRHWGNALAIGLGVLSALLIFPLAVESTNWLKNWYDYENPVVTAKILRAEMTDKDSMRIQFVVTRKRDCEFIRLLGMTGSGPTDMRLATSLQREDGNDPVSYPVGVTVTSQPWVLSPVFGPRLMLWAYYDCSDRVVRTKMIDEVIK